MSSIYGHAMDIQAQFCAPKTRRISENPKRKGSENQMDALNQMEHKSTRKHPSPPNRNRSGSFRVNLRTATVRSTIPVKQHVTIKAACGTCKNTVVFNREHFPYLAFPFLKKDDTAATG